MLVAACGACTPRTVTQDRDFGTLSRVVDGDTIRVVLNSGREEPVRLIGIDAPEADECFGDEATAAVTAMVPSGSTVELVADVTDRDQYDRLLRYVYLADGTHLNTQLVRGGYALAREYPPDTSLSSQMVFAQREAEQAKAGLWADCR